MWSVPASSTALFIVMRCRAQDGHGRDRYNPLQERDRLGKFQLVYDTAEASGCELEPPRELVDWA
jgi:hypothetical protein